MPAVAELDRLIATARDWGDDPMAIATVIATWGSAPRPRGSHMLVNADGRFEGSVSGGCVEGEVLAAAAETIADGQSRRLKFGVTENMAWEVGLPCGGEIEIFVQPVSEQGFAPGMFDAITEARGAGRVLRVATDLEKGSSVIAPVADEGGFLNLYAPPRRLLIIGAVQIAQSLAQIAAQIDTQAIVIDPRARFLTPERFPGVVLDDRWPDEAVAAHAPNAATAIVTLSHDPKIDDPALIAALRSRAGYVAALGSTRSHAKRLERLAAAGIAEAQLARLDAPAGLSIGAQGPAEIALSIAAGMVKAFRG